MGASISSHSETRASSSRSPHQLKTSNVLNNNNEQALSRQYKKIGFVKASVSFFSGIRQSSDAPVVLKIFPNGAFFYGSSSPPTAVIEDVSKLLVALPVDVGLRDSKAHQLLVTFCDGWYAIPAPVNFTRHAGTCLLIGDKSSPSINYKVEIGDCFRLGSVGVVVVGMRLGDGVEQSISPRTLRCLQEESNKSGFSDFEIESEAFRAIDEKKNKKTNQRSEQAQAGQNSEDTLQENGDNSNHSSSDSQNALCYMCYDNHDTLEDPLIAPCDCKGDTRYLHVSCLQKWCQNLGYGPNAVVIRTTANGNAACKICGAAYKTVFRDALGNKAHIVEANHQGPYISLLVVTRHDTSPSLFNTKFRLNFSSDRDVTAMFNSFDQFLQLRYPLEMTIGRSSACNMVLDYRTVSTVHAKLCFNSSGDATGRGAFFIEDLGSSNGTLLYLQKPLKLSATQKSVLRLGRSNIVFEVKKNFSMGAIGCVPCGGDFSSSADVYQASGSGSPSADELLALMSKSVPSSASSSSSSGPVRSSQYSRESVDGSSFDGRAYASMIPIIESMDVSPYPPTSQTPVARATAGPEAPVPVATALPRSDRSIGSSTVDDQGSLASCPLDNNALPCGRESSHGGRRVSSVHSTGEDISSSSSAPPAQQPRVEPQPQVEPQSIISASIPLEQDAVPI